MVGTLEDAEDIVQDTFEKWLSIDVESIHNTKAYLVRSVRNNCLQFLNSLKHKFSQKTTDTDENADIVDENQSTSFFQFDLEAQVQQAWDVLHRKLEPVEKSIFVLREVFSLEYDEMQQIFDKKADNLRQIVSRARGKIKDHQSLTKGGKPIVSVPEGFWPACQAGNFTDMIAGFRKEITEKLPSRK